MFGATDVTKPYECIGFGAIDVTTLRFLLRDFWAGRKSTIFGLWAAPGAPKTMPKCGGLRPPYFGMVSRAPGATQTPQIEDFRSLKNQPDIALTRHL